MKVIPTDYITDIAATDENSNYPATNLSDDHLENLFRANGTTTTLSIRIDPGADCFMLFNCNATNSSQSLKPYGAVDLHYSVDLHSSVDLHDQSGIGLTLLNGLDGTARGCLKLTWTASDEPLVLTLTLSNSNGDSIYAGTARAGVLTSSSGPNYGMNIQLVDMSIVDEMSNGSDNVKDRSDFLIISGSASIASDDFFDTFLNSIARVVKMKPAAWQITDIENKDWLVFARFTKMPGGAYQTTKRFDTSFQLKEAI